MSDENVQYRSKLLAQAKAGGPGNKRKKGTTSGSLTRGMGSAYKENQQMAGADNPEAAATMAGMDRADLQKGIEAASEAEADITSMREDLIYAIEEDGFPAPGIVEQAPAQHIMQWHAEMVEWRENLIEDEVESEAGQGTSFSLAPDDPLYDPLRDKARKRAIEKDLEPLDFESMVFMGYTEQQVPIRDSFNVTFRTISTQHGMWIEMMLTELSEYSAQYGRHWFSLTQVACAVQSINDKPIGTDLGRLSKRDQMEAFKNSLDERMEFLGRLPGLLTDELIVHHAWFIGRVRKMMTGDVIKKVGNS